MNNQVVCYRSSQALHSVPRQATVLRDALDRCRSRAALVGWVGRPVLGAWGQGRALAGRASLRDGGVRHPVVLPVGYHTTSRGQSSTRLAGGRLRRGLPPGRRAVGRCQADGMTHEPQRGWAEQTRSKPGANGLGAPVTSRDARARTRSSGRTRRHQASAAERLLPRSGRRGRRFKSCHPDHTQRPSDQQVQRAFDRYRGRAEALATVA